MVEKDVEFNIKKLILSSNNNNDNRISITNEFRSDGIVRKDGVPIAILEFKVKRDFSKENTLSQVFGQAMCYYYKLSKEEEISRNKPFYLIIGDENEIVLLNIHETTLNWMEESDWEIITPSGVKKNERLMEIVEEVIKNSNMLYWNYSELSEMKFGFYILFSDMLIKKTEQKEENTSKKAGFSLRRIISGGSK